MRDAVGEPLYFIAQIQDITERKQIEAALQESEERWQLALRGNNDGIWDWNVKTNEVFFSAQWKQMLGYEEHEISNHLDEWAKRVHLRDSSGAITGYLGTVKDISDRKRAEEALRQSEAREREKAKELELTLGELKRTQTQLIQAE